MSRFKEYYHSEIIYQFDEDVPEYPVGGIIYIVGESKFYWCLVMQCPCGCGDLIQLNLLRKANPRWNFLIRKRKISLYPSVWREKGCKSHFLVRKSKIIMVKEHFFNSKIDDNKF